MRSIHYRIFGEPSNMDDCIDLSNRLITRWVNLRLDTDDIISDMYIARRLIGIFIWKFNVKEVEVEQDFGGIFSYENEAKQKEWINKSNERLQKAINLIESHKVDVIGKEQKFDYSLIF